MHERIPLMSARAAGKIVDTTILERFATLAANPYHAKTSPGGIVNLGVAENVCLPSFRHLSFFADSKATGAHVSRTHLVPEQDGNLHLPPDGQANNRFVWC
jgi:hypothetical protein